MKNLILCICLGLVSIAKADTWPGAKPKLVVLVVIDQFRADYLSRFKNKFSENGFKALIADGAYFPFGEYDVMQSMTAPGHATVLTGAYPYQMGIPLNEWYDQKSKSVQYCVDDSSAKTVGGLQQEGDGRSPKNLLGTTVGDELKNADIPTRVYSIALKDRAAILMGGHRADLAMWYENKSSQWVSSDYYLKDRIVPAWMKVLNSKTTEKCNTTQVCGINLTVQAAQAAIEKLKLGSEKTTDVLAISFSSHDFAGHMYGPNAPEMELMTLAEDKAIENLRMTIQNKVPGGLKDVIFILTGDHGIPPSGDYLKNTGIDFGAIDEKNLVLEIEKSLSKKFGSDKTSKWINFVSDFNFYLDENLLRDKKLKSADVENEVKIILSKQSGFAHVITKSEVEKRQLPPGMFERQILKTFYAGRSGHVIALPKAFYTNVSHNHVTHMTSYTYDRSVPIIFSGMGIRKGTYAEKAEVVDIAPTLSFLLGVLPPALNEGRVLKEILKDVVH